ncbi:MAG: PAS domain S-box protein [Archaeoglobaceae archaeon]
MFDLLKLINSHLRHDVLNDLTTIRSILEIYQETKNEELLEDVFNKIDGSANFLKEMREVESMVSGGNLKPLNLVNALKPIRQKYEEYITFNIEGDCTVMADASLSSVFDNLVRNSLSHGKADRVDIKIMRRGEVCQVDVSDNGEGIPDHIRESIFEEGVSTNGTGLGLFIVKKTIQRYDGKIHLRDGNQGNQGNKGNKGNKGNQGTTFVILFNTTTYERETRNSGVDLLGRIGWGTHICHFYRNKDDLIDFVVPYFRAGLDNNEYCVWVISEFREEVQELVEQFPQMEVITYNEWYTTKDKQQIIDSWVEKLDQVLADGYDGLRVAGDAEWLNDLRDFINYEEDIQRVIDGMKIIAVCSYPFNKCSTSEIADLTSRHHYVLVVRDGEWELIKNFEYRRSQDVLQKIEEKYRTLVENANEGILVIQDGKIMYANPKAMEISGYSNDEIIFRSFFEFVHPDDRELVVRHYKEGIGDKKHFDSYQFRFKDKKGRTRWTKIKTTSIEWDGKPSILTLITDITPQKEAEEKLRKLKTSYQELFDKSGDAIFIHDPDTADILDVNQKMCELYGYTREEALNLKVGDLSQGEFYSHKKAKQWIQKAITEGPQSFEWRGKKKDGTIFWEEVTLKKATIGGKERILASVRDITERKRSENALKRSEEKVRESEELYSTLVEKVNDMVFMLDSRGNITFFNSYVRGHYSLSEEEAEKLYGTHISFFWCGESINEVKDVVDQVAELREELSMECICEDRYYLLKITPLFDLGELTGMVAVARDFTGHKRIEQRLRERERALEDIVEGSPVPKFVLDEDHKVTHWNRACENLSGVSSGDVVGTNKQWYPWYHEERPVMADLIIDGSGEDLVKYYGSKYLSPSIKEGAYEATDYFPHLGEDGRWLYFTACPLKNEEGRITGAIETIQDVTEQKRAEKLLKESEARYRATFEHTGTAMIVIEEDTTIGMANKECERLSGYKKEEIEGKLKWTEFVHPDDIERMMSYHSTRRKGEEAPNKYEFKLMDREGKIKDIFITIDLIPGTKKSVASLLDVTHLRTLNRLLRVISDINEMVARIKRPEVVLDVVCKNLNIVYEDIFACVIRDEKLIPIKSEGVSAESVKEVIDKCPSVQKALDGESLIISTNSDLCRRCTEKQHNYALSIPLIHEGQQGIITIHSNADFSGEEITLLSKLASNIAFALSAHKVEQDKVTAMEQLAKNLTQFDLAADRLRNPLAIIMAALELKDVYGRDELMDIVHSQTERIKEELDELRKEESATHELLEQSNLKE